MPRPGYRRITLFRTEERVKSGPRSVSPPGAECDRAAPSQPMRPHGRLSPTPWPRKRHALLHRFRRPAKDDGPCERRTPSPGRGPNRGLRRVPAREPDGQATFSQPSEIKALFPKQVTKGLLLDRKVAFEGWTRAASPEDPYPIAGRRLARSWLPAPAGRSGRRGGATAGHDGDPDPTSAGTAGDAALWGGSSAAVGMAANPFGAHQAAVTRPAERAADRSRPPPGASAGDPFEQAFAQGIETGPTRRPDVLFRRDAQAPSVTELPVNRWRSSLAARRGNARWNWRSRRGVPWRRRWPGKALPISSPSGEA